VGWKLFTEQTAQPMPLHITYIQGGMMEFQKTGIYPRRLTIFDGDCNRTWRRKITAENCEGKLKIGKTIIYSYCIDLDDDMIFIFDANGKQIMDFTLEHIMCD
jgi:hypothetical protein